MEPNHIHLLVIVEQPPPPTTRQQGEARLPVLTQCFSQRCKSGSSDIKYNMTVKYSLCHYRTVTAFLLADSLLKDQNSVAGWTGNSGQSPDKINVGTAVWGLQVLTGVGRDIRHIDRLSCNRTTVSSFQY